MKRIGYLLMFLLFSAGSQAQLSVTQSDAIVCETDTIWFTAMGYDSITWSGTATLDAVLGNTNYATGSEGNYTVRIIGWDTVGVATPEDTVDLNVEFTAGNLFSVTSTSFSETFDCGQDTLSVSVCKENTYTLFTSGVDSTFWTSTNTAVTLSVDSTGTSATITPPAFGSFFISIVGLDTSAGIYDTLIIELIQLDKPTVQINNSQFVYNNYVCLGGSAVLEVITDTSVFDFVTWATDSTLDTNMGLIVTATPDTVTTYFATVTNDFGCSTTGMAEVLVGYDTPKFSVEISPSTICPGDSASMEGAGIFGNVSRYEWSPNVALSKTVGSEVMAGPSSTTSYTVTGYWNGCPKDTTVTLNVYVAPAMSVSQTATGSIKLDETTTITVGCETCLKYVWDLPGATLNTTSNVQTVSPNTPGANLITIEGTDSNACKSSVGITVTVDSSFIGDPFPPASIDELDAQQIKVISTPREVRITAGAAIEHVSLYNLLGTKIYEVNGSRDNQLTVPSQDLAAGVYIVNVRSIKAEKVEKVYVQ